MIDIGGKDRQIIKDILQKYVPNCEVLAYGSRCNGTARKYSDLDIAIVGSGEIPLLTLAELEDAFGESDLLFSVDLHDWNTMPQNFRDIVNN
jgi:predicted nucleotidyltransferase